MSWQHDARPLHDPAAADAWRALWQRSPQSSVFTQYEYALCVAESFGMESEIHLVHGENGRAEAGVITYVRQRGPFRTAVVPPLTPYNSPILAGSLPDSEVNQRRSAFEYLLTVLESRYDEIRFQLHPSLIDARAAVWRGWNAKPYYTYIAPLAPGVDLTVSWSRKTRRAARVESALFTVQEDPQSAEIVTGLHVGSLTRQKHRLSASAPVIREHLERLVERRIARLFTATPRGRTDPVAGAAVLCSGSEAHYWLVGSAPGSSMTVLVSEMLPLLAANGVTSIDYDGANTPGIAEFKRHFGGVLVPYVGIHRAQSTGVRILSKAQDLYATVRTRR